MGIFSHLTHNNHSFPVNMNHGSIFRRYNNNIRFWSIKQNKSISSQGKKKIIQLFKYKVQIISLMYVINVIFMHVKVTYTIIVS